MVKFARYACIPRHRAHTHTRLQPTTRSTFKYPSKRGPHFNLELKCGEIDRDLIAIDRALRVPSIACKRTPPSSATVATQTDAEVIESPPAKVTRRRGQGPIRPESVDVDAWQSADLSQRRKWVKQQYNRKYQLRKKEQRRLAAEQEKMKDKDDASDDVGAPRALEIKREMDAEDVDTTDSRTQPLYHDFTLYGDSSTDARETDEKYEERPTRDDQFHWW